jgi:hypothetical protein
MPQMTPDQLKKLEKDYRNSGYVATAITMALIIFGLLMYWRFGHV